MRQVKEKSVIPYYGTAGVALLYCLILPLYQLKDFLFLLLVCAGTFFLLRRVCPAQVRYGPEEPVTTGNAEIDALLKSGREMIGQMQTAAGQIASPAVREKGEKLADLAKRIVQDVVDDPKDYRQVKRFCDYFLPTTVKLLENYRNFETQGISGENISAVMERTESVLDLTREAYEKQLDALFSNEALDIDTDITVLESMIKKEGLSGSDFKTNP